MFDQKKINRKSNLEVGDSLSAYDGLTCQQNPYAFEAFYTLLKTCRPNRILEIGASLGGFTQYLHHILVELSIECNIRTYDIYDRYEYKLMREKGIDVRLEDIFSNTYKELTNKEVIIYIQSDGLTLVLCDGGSKIDEFNIFSKLLKNGDIIMAHDYAFDEKTFKRDIDKKYWLWHEISESDIEDAVKEYHLRPYMQQKFNKAVWVCKIKDQLH